MSLSDHDVKFNSAGLNGLFQYAGVPELAKGAGLKQPFSFFLRKKNVDEK